ncbi:MAG: DUF4845 domain-containing protein [Pseudomonadota bacterium]
MRSNSNLRSRQHGMGMIGWMTVIGVVVVFMKVGFTLGPIYWNHYKALNVIKKVVANPSSGTYGPAELRGALQRYWDIEDITHFQPKDIKVIKTNTGRAFQIDYEVREPFFKEVSFLVHFAQDLPLPGGIE